MANLDLDALFESHGDWPNVLADLELTCEAAEDPVEKARALTRMGQVHAFHLGAPAQAAELLESALEADESNLEAWAALADAYEAAEDWESLSAVLLDTVPLVSEAAEKGALLRRAAAAYADGLKQPEGAKLLLDKALDEAPFEQETWAAIAEFGAAQGTHRAVADQLNAHAALVAEARGEAASLPLILAVAKAHEADGNLDMADIFLTRAGLVDPQDEGVLAAQLRVQEASEDWASSEETLAKLADLALEAAAEAALQRRLGRLRVEHLGNVEGAITAFERAFALESAPDDGETLAALYEATGRSAELVTMLRGRVAAAEPAEQAGIWLQIAALQRGGLAEPAEAISSYRSALAAQPGDAQALLGLAELLQAAEDWSGLAEHFETWAETLEAPSERAAVLMQRATVLEASLSDALGALAAVEQARALDPATDGCLPALARLLDTVGRGAETPAVHMHMAELAGDRAAWRTHVMDAAAAFRTSGDAQGAMGAYQSVLDAEPADAEALRALQTLQAQAGDVAGAVASLRQRVTLADGDDARVALLLEAAALEAQADPASPVATLTEALELAPEHAGARSLMAQALEAGAQWPALAEHLEGSAALERDLKRRAALRARAGGVRAEHLNDSAGARSAWEAAIADDPGCVDAARPLAAALVDEAAWVRARPLLETLVANGGALSAAERAHDLARLAQALEGIGLPSEAVPRYEQALDLAPDDVASGVALAGLYAGTGRFLDADRIYRPLTLEQAEAIEESKRVLLFLNAGQTAAALAEADRAADLYGRALALSPQHTQTLKAIAALEGGSDTTRKTGAQQALLAVTEDPDERFKLQLEIADGFVEANDTDRAIAAVRGALRVRPESKAALHKLLSICTAAERWEPAADVLVTLAEKEEDPARRSKLLFTVGAVYRDQLVDFERAQNVFDNLLDREPLRMDAIEAIEALHRDRGAWKTLEKAYRRQLERVVDIEGAEDMQFALATAIARLYRDKLNRPDDAIAALKLAARLRPDDVDSLVAIAEIYPSSGKTDADIIVQHRAIVAVDPQRQQSHQVLFDALRRERRYDEAWTTAALLTVLGSRDSAATTFYTEHRPRTTALARIGLGHADWRAIQHPELSAELTGFLGTIAAVLRRVYSQELKAWGVHPRKDRVDLTTPAPVTNLFHYASQFLSVPMPDVYAFAGASGLVNANTEPRAILVGSELLSGSADRRKVFHVSRAMCLIRNDFYLASALQVPTLTALVQACIALFTGGPPKDWDSETLRAWMAAIGDESDEVLATLGEAVRTVVASGAPLDLKRWCRAVEFTAGRVGLLTCGDLQRAAQAASEVTNVVGAADAHERVLDLVAFSATDEYSRLRAELGLGIGQQ